MTVVGLLQLCKLLLPFAELARECCWSAFHVCRLYVNTQTWSVSMTEFVTVVASCVCHVTPLRCSLHGCSVVTEEKCGIQRDAEGSAPDLL